MSDQLRLQLENTTTLALGMVNGAGTYNYERLYNKPSLNGVELIGDRTVEELLADGIIIDGGDASDA